MNAPTDRPDDPTAIGRRWQARRLTTAVRLRGAMSRSSFGKTGERRDPRFVPILTASEIFRRARGAPG